jgi:hypothetical protein
MDRLPISPKERVMLTSNPKKLQSEKLSLHL